MVAQRVTSSHDSAIDGQGFSRSISYPRHPHSLVPSSADRRPHYIREHTHTFFDILHPLPNPDNAPTSSTSGYASMIWDDATYITRVRGHLHAFLRVFSRFPFLFPASPRDARIMWSPPLPLPCMFIYCTRSHQFTSTTTTLIQPRFLDPNSLSLSIKALPSAVHSFFTLPAFAWTPPVFVCTLPG
jgi:hypothetical protein